MFSGREGKWRFIDSGFHSGSFNMALDQVLLQSEEKSGSVFTLRLYGWRPPALSLGYFQRIGAGVHQRCRVRGIEVVRRPTGGRAVLHDRELTYSVTGPVGGSIGRSVREIYLEISKALALGLRKLGVAAELVDPRGNKREARHGYVMKEACFASQTQGEIAVGNRKVVGSAQRQVGNRFLQHGSIPLEPAVIPLAALFGRKDEDESRSSITIAEALGRAVTFREVGAAVKEGFTERFGVDWEERGPSPTELQAANRLAGARYRFAEWPRQEVNPAVA